MAVQKVEMMAVMRAKPMAVLKVIWRVVQLDHLMVVKSGDCLAEVMAVMMVAMLAV